MRVQYVILDVAIVNIGASEKKSGEYMQTLWKKKKKNLPSIH